jgi:hypothetical protein
VIHCENRRFRAGAAVLCLALVAVGCGDDPVSPDAAALGAARARWESAGFERYEYHYRLSCFCPPQVLETARVRVEDGQVTDVYLLDSDAPAEPGTWDLYSTVDELFDRLAEALSEGPAQFEATYDPALGYPTSAAVDISKQIADEEYSFTASDLTALEP